MFRHYEQVGEVRERSVIGDDAREGDLCLAAEDAEAECVANGPVEDIARHVGRPVT